MELFNLFVKSIFIDNMVFAYFLGMCSYLAVSKKVTTAIGLGIAVVFVLLITAPFNWLLYHYMLKPGALVWINESFKDVDLSFLSFLIFIASIAAIVQLVEMAVEKFSPALYSSLGIFLPLIAVNCVILAVALFVQEKEDQSLMGLGISEVTIYAVGSGIGWFLAIISMAAIREKITYSNIPKPLRGLGITFIITGLMAFAFMGFMGIKI
ncbi:MAG TPA: NADH:ubiquinone reductase (Na(+)-transporting) subunit E [Bacteroidales bacterium]|nr:MAG: NADH:ubiquinone reductase (Na(+)-transporting) subunit E [Bacteroidetes bacterium GWF2_33_38]OFY75492.1 MAG: NADH:ubiquinone reductase (Na(+)-transporting) subunit E [Bacteroidetes bacterium RIFOXYA12_FULL_33_9]OFY85462.1 MAG: NADH:ubiquinone reductase (Na(+)-transporting) subunit E [Bacteroidetes bacterium RIFOXYA2_FULL_33_7]HBF87859.1 NADH:ubiquinone reductase (Na(+)-transporting) subunit E [Bacteroidales bacterium]